MTVELHGYKYSVYSWIARFALHEKGVAYTWQEIDPFSAETPEAYLRLHPFKRVPVLVHDDFVVYETNAITRYIDEAFTGPRLQPSEALLRARVNQIISVIDSYGYWPLVRQVFSHGVFRARTGRPADLAETAAGLAAAPRVLDALEALALDKPYICGEALTLGDVHLAPMISYFAEAPDGKAMLAQRARLNLWASAISNRAAFQATRPELP